jgi:DNA-binding CsgD family transcriptional regulator
MASLLIYAGMVTAFLRYDGVFDFMDIFARGTLASLLVVSLLILILEAFRIRIPLKAMMGVGGVLHLVGCGVFGYAALSSNNQSLVLLCAGAVASGSGECLLCLAWGRLFSRFKLRDALLNISIACILSLLVYALIVVVPPLFGVALFLLCAVISVVALLLVKRPTEHESVTQKAAAGSTKKILSSFKSFAGIIVEPASGLFAFSFMMGLASHFFYEIFWTYFLAGVLAAIMPICLAFVKIRKPLTRLLYQNFIPVLAIIVLSAMSISQLLFSGTSLSMFFMLLLYCFAAILTIANLCAIANASEFSSNRIFATALVLFAIASLLGITCSSILPVDVVLVIITIITTVYVVGMLLNRSIRSEEGFPLGRQGAESERAVLDRCSELAESRGLTAREHEILIYLARGYSNAYISEMLFISPNTVRTHIHNMYKKIDASSREDIIDITRA